MAFERLQRPPPQEKSFGQLFPWRNIRRAMMLVLLIVAIVVIKRSAEPALQRVGQMWGSPGRAPVSRPVQIRAVVRPGAQAAREAAAAPSTPSRSQ